MTTGRPRWRLRFALFFPRLWLVKEWRASSLPVAVFLKRFLAPEWIFIFGIERCIEAEAPGRTRGLLRSMRLGMRPAEWRGGLRRSLRSLDAPVGLLTARSNERHGEHAGDCGDQNGAEQPHRDPVGRPTRKSQGPVCDG